MKRTPEAVSLWVLLMIFPRVILPVTPIRNSSDAYSQARIVKERLQRWRRGDYMALWEEAIKLTKPQQKKKKKGAGFQAEQSQEEQNAKRSTRLAQDGQFTRALQALCSSGLAEHSRATLQVMQDKHPAPLHPSTFQLQTDTPQMTFTTAQVVKAISTFRKSSAPGPTGLRAEHLQCVMKTSAPNRVDKIADAVTGVINLMAKGGVPDAVAPFLCGANLFGAVKKDGGVRPIAVGNLLRRITSKCFSFATSDRAAAFLGPLQLGVGIRGGLEAIIHAVRQVVEEGDESLGVLQVDLINAYNLVDRDSVFQEVQEHFPEMIKWVLTSYGSQAELVFGKFIILSQTGLHQGDPLAGFLFSLVLQTIIRRIHIEVPSLKINSWYLDDGTQAGIKEDLKKVVDIITEDGPARGLFLSTSSTVTPPSLPKSTVWFPHQATRGHPDPLQRGIPCINDSGIELLGTPVGGQIFTEKTIRKRLEKIRHISDKLPLIQDAHTEFSLLRSCLSIPKVMYTLRTTDPSTLQCLWREFDSMTRESLDRILGVPLNSTQWLQAQLPVSLGGVGLKSAEDHSSAAYVSSKVASRDLMAQILKQPDEDSSPRLSALLLTLLSAKQGEEATVENLSGVAQKATSLKIDLCKHQRLTEQVANLGTQRDKARLASLGLPHSGDWLNVIPSPSLGLHLRTPEWITSAKYRLGCNVFSRDGQCPACSQPSDAAGDHAVSCGSEGERIARHNHLRDHLFNTCASAALSPLREERALIPGSDARPADVLIPNWSSGKATALDVTVVNPLQAKFVDRAADRAGHALEARFNEKMTRHGQPCREAGLVFAPLVVETLGGWEEQAVIQIKKIGAALARQTGQDEGEKQRHLFQRLGILLARGNAALFLNRRPSHPDPIIDGNQ